MPGDGGTTPAADAVEVSIEEGLLAALADRRRRRDDASTCWAGSITGAGRQHPRVDWEDFRAGGFMFVFRPGAFDGAPHTYIASLQGPGRRRRARADAGRPGVAVPERVGDRPARDPADGPGHREQRDAGGHGGRLAGAVQRRPDPGRRRVDDEVPARLRGGDPEDARRQPPADRHDAAARVRRAGRDCRHRRRARRDRPQLGGGHATRWNCRGRRRRV